MNQWTRISLLSMMLFTATMTFTAAPAAALYCDAVENTWNPDLNQCTNGAYGIVCDEYAPQPCVYDRACGEPSLNACVDLIHPCVWDPSVDCIMEECGGVCGLVENQRIWLEDYSVVRTSNQTTVTVVLCNREGYSCNTYTQSAPLGSQPQVCFAYTPGAWTNACIKVVDDATVVGVPTIVTSPHQECIIGNLCVTAPIPGVGPSQPKTVAHPNVDGYVELTRVCNLLDRDTNDCYVPL